MSLRPRRLHGLGIICLLVFPTCGGGGGGGGPVNPAPAPPAAALTIDMEGFWECTASAIVETNTMFTSQFQVGHEIALESHRITAGTNPTTGTLDSFLRADIERELGGPLDSYVNQADGRNLTFGIGASGPGGNAQYGLRLAVLDAGTLVGFEAENFNLSAEPNTRWVAQLVFRRTLPPAAAVLLTDTETESGGTFLSRKLERIQEGDENR